MYVDRDRFEQILGNVVSNAVKYGDRKSGIRIHLAQMGDDVKFGVANRGKGIPKDELSAYLHAVRANGGDARSGVSGLGLGLYIARGLVEAHGGRMWAESVPGDTTTFKLFASLPRPRRGGGVSGSRNARLRRPPWRWSSFFEG